MSRQFRAHMINCILAAGQHMLASEERLACSFVLGAGFRSSSSDQILTDYRCPGQNRSAGPANKGL